MDQAGVMERADAFEDALLQLEPRLRVGWLTYVLEGLDNHLGPEEMEELLASLVDDVNSRLRRLRW